MKKLLPILSMGVLAGCSAIPLQPGAERVLLSNADPSPECVFIAEVSGGQGNWWTDDITSSQNIVEGSRNDLRNKAFELGANYVHIQQVADSNTYMGGSTMGIVGNAYDCGE